MSSGMSDKQILADYPDLEEADLQAACAFGARLARVQRIEPVGGGFFVDAQLPQHLAQELTLAGYDTLHTLDLPHGNRTPDEELAALATREERILITKDSDFVTTFHLQNSPPKLLLVSTGNIDNATLLQLFLTNLLHLERALTENDFVELGRTALTIHG